MRNAYIYLPGLKRWSYFGPTEHKTPEEFKNYWQGFKYRCVCLVKLKWVKLPA